MSQTEEIWMVGDRPKITIRFTDSAGALVDPAVVKAQFRTPGLVVTTYTFGVDAALVKDGIGIYHFYLSLTAAGVWGYRAYSTGTHIVANEGSLKCEESLFD